MLANSNKGMYLETVINRSSSYYENDGLLFFKRNIPIKIIKNNNNFIQGKIDDKSTTDYYGIYRGLYIDFEAKQTNKESFYLRNIKPHQLSHLEKIYLCGGFSFIILYFVKFDSFFCIELELLKKQKIKIDYEWCKNNAFELQLFFPGVINIIDFIKQTKGKYECFNNIY